MPNSNCFEQRVCECDYHKQCREVSKLYQAWEKTQADAKQWSAHPAIQKEFEKFADTLYEYFCAYSDSLYNL
jgi:hypothetical protein